MSASMQSRAPLPEDLLFDGFQALRRVDQGERAWTYYAEGWGQRAAMKVLNPHYRGRGFIEDVEAGFLHHPCIPRGLTVGANSGLYYYVRSWVEGVTFDELVASPPSRENTTRLCRALLRLAETLASLHRDGEHGPPRVHGAINGRNVIVTPEGDVGLINFQHSHLAAVPRLERDGEDGLVYLLTTESESSKRRDLEALLRLIPRIWEPLGASVVSIDAAVPRPVSDLRRERYDSVDTFRGDLEIALTIAGIAPQNTPYDSAIR